MKQIGMEELDRILDSGTSGTTKPTALTKPSTALSRPSTQNAERKKKIALALQAMSISRGEPMDEVRLRLFSAELIEVFSDDGETVAVLKKLQCSQRSGYELRIPPLGDIIAMVRDVSSQRKSRAATLQRINEVEEWRAIWERERREEKGEAAE